MKTWQNIKNTLNAFWEPLDDKYMLSQQKKRDIRTFMKFYEKLLFTIYFLFGLFSITSLYFFTTRVIF